MSDKLDFTRVIDTVKKYDTVIVVAHLVPDFDAYGSSFGLVTYLRNMFPKKTIYILGWPQVSFSKELFPDVDTVLDDDLEGKDILTIAVDTSNLSRLGDLRVASLSKEIIKIDHHKVVDSYGTNINLVDDKISSCAEYLARLMYSYNKKYIDLTVAKYLFIGMVGDSGRFLYKSVNAESFLIASKLISLGIKPYTDVYLPMYEKDLHEIEILQYIYNNYVLNEKKNIIYFVITDKAQKLLGLDSRQGTSYVNTFSNYKGVDVWVAATEDVNDQCFYVSLRSKELAVNIVAEKYQGGGHANAAGCKVKDLDELKLLIKDLEDKL